MSDYDDRGAYTPPSDRLAFDPRQPVRGGGPAPVTLIVSGLVLASLVGGVFFLYRDGFKHHGATPALVGAPVADARSPAPPQVADANAAPPGLTIDKTASAGPPPAFGPPPAQPLPPAATPAPQASAPTPAQAAATPPPAARTPPTQVVMLQPDESSAVSTAPKKVMSASALAKAPKKVAATPALAAAPLLAAAPPKKVVAAPVTEFAAAPPKKTPAAPASKLAAAAPPAERPATRHASTMTIASLANAAIAERPRYHAPTANEFKPRAGEAVAPMAVPSHRVVASEVKPVAATAPTIAAAVGWVQIGAFSSEALADQGWHDLARVEPAAMAGKGRAVQPFTRDDGAVLYRAYVTGFASVPAAQSFCSELRAAGKGCIVK